MYILDVSQVDDFDKSQICMYIKMYTYCTDVYTYVYIYINIYV